MSWVEGCLREASLEQRYDPPFCTCAIQRTMQRELLSLIKFLRVNHSQDTKQALLASAGRQQKKWTRIVPRRP